LKFKFNKKGELFIDKHCLDKLASLNLYQNNTNANQIASELLKLKASLTDGFNCNNGIDSLKPTTPTPSSDETFNEPVNESKPVKASVPSLFTTAAFAQTKFGSTKCKNFTKKHHKMLPNEFSVYIKQKAHQQFSFAPKDSALNGNTTSTAIKSNKTNNSRQIFNNSPLNDKNKDDTTNSRPGSINKKK
jgi:hypothetical protein